MAPSKTKKSLPERVAVAEVRKEIIADMLLLGFEDLLALGYVSSRADLSRKVASGVLPPPFKMGDTQQSGAKWVAGRLRRHVEARARADEQPDIDEQPGAEDAVDGENEGSVTPPLKPPKPPHDSDTAGRREKRPQRQAN